MLGTVCIVFVFQNIIQKIYLKQSIIRKFITPVSSYDVVTSLCSYSSISEARKVFVYVNGETDAV